MSVTVTARDMAGLLSRQVHLEDPNVGDFHLSHSEFS